MKTVIVVMGEKKADALQKVLGSSAVVVSWAGGDNGRSYTDFSALKGCNVIIWPDADPGGKAAAVGETDKRGERKPGAAEYILNAGAAGVKVIVPPSDVEKGWDAADLIRSVSDRQAVKDFILRTSTDVASARRIFDLGSTPTIDVGDKGGKNKSRSAEIKVSMKPPVKSQTRGPTLSR